MLGFGTFYTLCFLLSSIRISQRIETDGHIVKSVGMQLRDLYRSNRKDLLFYYHNSRAWEYLIAKEYKKFYRRILRAEKYAYHEDSAKWIANAIPIIYEQVDKRTALDLWQRLEPRIHSDRNKCRITDLRASLLLYDPDSTREDVESALVGLNNRLDRTPDNDPQSLVLTATKGAVCVRLGLTAEARPCLERIMAESQSPFDLAICGAVLAKLCALAGETERAKALLAAAVPIDSATTDRDAWDFLQRTIEETEGILGQPTALNFHDPK